MRRCSECGYSWTMPKKGHSGHLNEGIELTPHLQSAAHLMGEQALATGAADAEVREALSHCPQCGSGHFTEYRADPT
jgi:ribosomal protein S27AE